MLELLVCSLVTILPDFLFRRYGQGKRLGREITLFSIWFELRWGLTACVLLTVSLITLVFFYHPSSASAASYFRSIPLLPEASGRVVEVHVGLGQEVKAGDKLFTLDSSAETAALLTAQSAVAEVDAALAIAQTDLAVAQGRIQEARSGYQQALDELETRIEIRNRNADAVAVREIEKAQNIVNGRQGALDTALANLTAVEVKIAKQLPAQRASAEAALAQAEVALSKMVVFASVDGRVEQFSLRPGDIVNPFMRPAGLLIPMGAGRGAILAGFNQIESPVLHPGMIGEAACISMPFQIISLVVTDVQTVIATGQIQSSDRLIDVANQATAPGSLTVILEPLFEGEIDALPPGSSCMVNVYTSNHDRLHSDETLTTLQRTGLHVIDTVGLVHALLLRMQALLLPVQTLVLSGGH